jgi:hypothetical protein
MVTPEAPAPPKLLDQVRDRIRVRHLSIRTEKQYVQWIKRFIYFHGKRHPRDMGAVEVEAFLTDLAVTGGVASSTQNQALSALLFLYREVLEITLPWLDNVTRAKASRRLPVVLTPVEVRSVLDRMDGTPLLNRRMLLCVFTGFSSGLPLYLLLNLLPAWLRSEGVNLKTIGLFALIQFPYTWKFLWAPLLDRYVPPLGRRRGWMVMTQVGLLCSIAALGLFSPAVALQFHCVAYGSDCLVFSHAGYCAGCLPARDFAGGRTRPGQFSACECVSHRRAGAGVVVVDSGGFFAVGAGVLDHGIVHAAGFAAGFVCGGTTGGEERTEDFARGGGGAVSRVYSPRGVARGGVDSGVYLFL